MYVLPIELDGLGLVLLVHQDHEPAQRGPCDLARQGWPAILVVTAVVATVFLVVPLVAVGREAQDDEGNEDSCGKARRFCHVSVVTTVEQ